MNGPFYLREARYALRDATDALGNAQDSLDEAIAHIIPDDITPEECRRYLDEAADLKSMHDAILSLRERINLIEKQVESEVWSPTLLEQLQQQNEAYREMEDQWDAQHS